MTVINYFKT